MSAEAGTARAAEGAGPQDVRSLLQALHALGQAPVDEAWWARYCSLLAPLCRARGVVAVQQAGEGTWSVLGQGGEDTRWLGAGWPRLVGEVAARAAGNGFAYTPCADDSGAPRILAAVRLLGVDQSLVLLDIGQQERGMLNELLLRAMLVAHVGAPGPAAASQALAAPAAPAASVAVAAPDAGLLTLLDLVSQVMQDPHFELAALKLVNGIAAHFALVQCALGWECGHGHVRAVAVSHLERFERRTENIRLIEAAMEEAAAEEDALCEPPAEGLAAGGPAHGELLGKIGCAQVSTLPLRDAQGNVQAVLLFAWGQAHGRLPESTSLLLALDLLQPWLADRRQRDRWWGLRLAAWAQGHLERWAGPGHPWIKAGAAAATLALAYAVFGTWDYRVEATAQLSTDATRVVSAQFDGRVEEVKASAGDLVHAGDVLAVLDTRDLRQQEVESAAECQRYEAEAARHRADNNLADMEVALARLAQAQARLARVRDYLAHARNLAPFDGVVVEGERKDLLGMPVKKGDHLFRIAQVRGLYAMLHVPERDIRDVRPGAHGELSLLSRPDEKIAFELSALIPVAQVKGQDGNQFMLTARLLTPPEAWWRPGMTGVARIDVGPRNVAWVATHRLVDALRMKFWW